jgi:hypothetical protein
MQELCHRCGGELPKGYDESPFCPHCGTPQLFLALENQSVETGGEPSVAPDGTPSTGRTPPPRPQQVDWKTAIRGALLVAGIGSVLKLGAMRVDVLAPVSLMWAVLAPVVALALYQRRSPSAWMDVRVGVKIGLLVGLFLAIGLSMAVAGWGLVARFGLHTISRYDAQISEQLAEGQRQAQQFMASRSMPMAPEMVAFEKSPEFRAGMELFRYAFLSACLLLMSALGGALGGMLKMRRGSVA